MERTLLYVLLIGALISLAGLAAEALLGLARRAQRGIWVICLVLSLAIPFGAMYWMERSDALAFYQQLAVPQWPQGMWVPATPSVSASMSTQSATASAVPLNRAEAVNVPGTLRSRLEPIALMVWLLSSIAMLGAVAGSAAVLGRKLSGLESATLCGATVKVSDSLGPAVIGLRTPQIVVPQWILLASAAVQKAAIAHETEHVRNHDARLLFMGVLLVSVMPWNPALWWQLRRLRFAIEKDCDRRVIARGFDAIDYSRALVAVAKFHIASPLAAVALGERATMLERRIRRLLRPQIRHRIAWGTGALFALLSCLGVAVELRPPDAAPPLWPSVPDESPFYAKALAAARAAYPKLFSGEFSGTVEIEVDLSLDGSVTGTRTYSYPAGPIDYSSTDRDVGWFTLLRFSEEGYRAAGAHNFHFLGWYGQTHQSGLYLMYGVYRWSLDAERNPIRALQLVNEVHPDFVQGACFTASYPDHPRTLTVLFRDNGTIGTESWSDTPGTTDPQDAEKHFEALGYDHTKLAHWGRVPTYLHGFPAGCLAPAGSLYYAWPRRPTDPIIDFKADRRVLRPLETVAMRETDHVRPRAQRLFEYYFPDVWSSGPTSEDEFVLLLLDRAGRVVAQRQGSHAAVEPLKLVEKGLAGHRAQLVTRTGVTSRSGEEVDICIARIAEDDQG